MNEDKVLESLLKVTEKLTALEAQVTRASHDLEVCREKIETNKSDIASLTVGQKSLGVSLDNERKLNRDRQVDTSKLLDDKMDTIYKGVSILTTVISLVISFLHGFFTK